MNEKNQALSYFYYIQLKIKTFIKIKYKITSKTFQNMNKFYQNINKKFKI